MGKYMHGERQKAKMIQAGIDLWHEGGAGAVTARGIGKRINLSHAGVLFHFDGIDDLRQQVKIAAVERGDKMVIQSLLVSGDPVVAHFDEAARRAWMAA
jgi:DNA-binding transcriptional regulator YbjK